MEKTSRFLEPSTWAGIGAALAAVLPVVNVFGNSYVGWGMSGLAAFAGGLAVWLREKPGK